jgi:hypothetical protein
MKEENGEYFSANRPGFDMETAEGFGSYLRHLRVHAPADLIERCRQTAQVKGKQHPLKVQTVLTQELVAIHIGSSQRWYAKLEAGQILRPDRDRITVLAELYGLCVDTLITGLGNVAKTRIPKGGYCPSPFCPDIDLIQLFLTGKFILFPAYFRIGETVSKNCLSCGESLVVRCPSCEKGLGPDRQRFCGHCGEFLYRNLMDRIIGSVDEPLHRMIDEDGAAWILFEAIKEKQDGPLGKRNVPPK